MSDVSNTPLKTRIIAGTGALLFLITSVGVTGVIVWDAMQNKTPDSEVATEQLTQPTTTPPKNPLQGTQLANFSPIDKVSELKVQDTKVGSGAEAKAGQTLVVDYTGAIAATGKIFQSSLDTGSPATLSLDQVIAGWKEGIPGMKVGGERRLIIPAEKAYGASSPSPDIPENADLVFDITLRSIN